MISSTLVDALSADPDYSSLLRLLQRADLILTLNKLNGSTLLAPTNDAIKQHGLTRIDAACGIKFHEGLTCTEHIGNSSRDHEGQNGTDN